MSVRCPKCGYGIYADAEAVLVLCPKCGEYMQRVCALRRVGVKDCETCSNYELQELRNCWKNRSGQQ